MGPTRIHDVRSTSSDHTTFETDATSRPARINPSRTRMVAAPGEVGLRPGFGRYGVCLPLLHQSKAGECGERDAGAEERSRDNVREPVHLEVGSAPGHSEDSQRRKRPPPAPLRSGHGEEKDERNAGRTGVCGVPRRKRRADRMNETVGRTRPADQDLQRCRTQRRHRLRHAERKHCDPSPPGGEQDPDRRKREHPAETAAKPVENKGDVGQRRRADVQHRFRPALIDTKRLGRHDQRHQQHRAQ